MILEPSTSSGEQSASAVISAMPARLADVSLLPPSSGSATLKIYDNATTSSGTILFETTVFAGTNSANIMFSMPRFSTKGLYASLTGTTTYVVGYALY